MRDALLVSVVALLLVQLSGCSAGTTQSDGTTSDLESPDTPTGEDEAPAQGDDAPERALAAARAFGEELGPVLVAPPDARGFEACERAGELMNRAAALREVGVPAGVRDSGRYREDVARLHSDATLMSTHCQGGDETVDSNVATPVELTFYRVLLQLQALRAEATDEGAAVAAARALLEVLDPITTTPMDERPAAVCARIEELAASVGRLREASVPPQLASSRHYTEDMTRLAAASNMAATYCGRGAETLTPDLVISIEVTSDRLWLMMHGQWPGAPAPAP
jgi:hypothetical protein